MDIQENRSHRMRRVHTSQTTFRRTKSNREKNPYFHPSNVGIIPLAGIQRLVNTMEVELLIYLVKSREKLKEI